MICTGPRCYDAALVFKYSEYDFNAKPVESIESAAFEIMKEGGYAISTYTALMGVRNALKKINAEVK